MDEAPTPKDNPSGPGPRFVSLALAQLKATLFDALDRTLHVHELYRKRLLGGGSALLARESHVLRQLHVHDSPAAIDVEHDLSRDLPLQELPDPPQGLVGKAVDHALVLPRSRPRRGGGAPAEARLAAAARAARHRSRRPSSVPSLALCAVRERSLATSWGSRAEEMSRRSAAPPETKAVLNEV